MQSITPANIASAALIAQFVVIVILFVALILVQATTASSEIMWIVFAVALITVGCLLFSDQVAALWRPLFGNAQVDGLRLSTAMLITFMLDILLAAILVFATGGSVASPFTPMYFLIPVLAIFLHESSTRVIWYSVAVMLFFSFTMLAEDPTPVRHSRLAYWFVAFASFVLVTLIGLITRPH